MNESLESTRTEHPPKKKKSPTKNQPPANQDTQHHHDSENTSTEQHGQHEEPVEAPATDAEVALPDAKDQIEKASIQHVAVSSLKPHALNAVIYGEEPVDEDLVKSIQADGITSPLTIDNDFTVISGHRRLQAAKALNLQSVPVIMRSYPDDTEKINALLTSNIQRKKSNDTIAREAIELMKIAKARALKRKQHAASDDSENDALSGEDEQGTARDNVGKILGISGLTAEKMIKVMGFIDRLVEEKNEEDAKTLRSALKKSASCGVKAAQDLGLLPRKKEGHAPKPQATDSPSSTPPPPAKTDSKPSPASQSTSPKAPKDKVEPSPYEPASPSIDSHPAALKMLKEITLFVSDTLAEDISDGQRQNWAEQFAELQDVLMQAGIIG